MKQIHIQGKQHIYKCMKANLDENADKYKVREGMEDLNEELFTHAIQFDMIRRLYLGNSDPPAIQAQTPKVSEADEIAPCPTASARATDEIAPCPTASARATDGITPCRPSPTARAAVGIAPCRPSPTASGIAKKIAGYKSQDIKKEMYDKDQLITFDEVVEKLVASKLKCCYCSCQIMLIYKNVREPTQWTLDRKDNDLCHSCDNTVIACLKCNLQRRVTNVDKFEFTKKLKIQKGF
uniref:Uncharacterized protein n=1 Tax=viral metagenome TaxID=1070528 RepID=A0A6C0HHF3_9ZZZZ